MGYFKLRLRAALLLALLGVVVPFERSNAACTISDAALATGQTTVCSGSFNEESYNFSLNVQNATIINNGVWLETGNLENATGASIIGPRTNTTTNFTGLTITNNGTLSWLNATATGVNPASQRTMTVMGTYFQTQTTGSLTFVNNGSITGVAGATSLSSFGGMGAVSRSGNNRLDNNGTITMDGSQITNANGAVMGMLAFGGSRTVMRNVGSIVVEGGPRLAEGIDYTYASSFSGYVTGVVDIQNLNSVRASATTGDAYGIGAWITDSTTAPRLTKFTISNYGNIEAISGSSGVGIFISSNNKNVPFEVANYGSIIGSEYSLYSGGSSLAPVFLSNFGTMTGYLETGRADDRVDTWGQIVGSVILGNGSDALTFYAPAPLTQLTGVDGGDDVFAADGFVDVLKFSGGNRTIDAGLLQNWETIRIADGATLSFTGSSLLVGGGTDSGGAQLGLIVEAASTWVPGTGSFRLIGDLSNAGTVSLANGNVGDTLTVALNPSAPPGASGNYIGSGGALRLDTVLAGDGAQSDRLVIDGGGASGSTALMITNVGGLGDLTHLDGILVVDAVNGGSTQPGAFTLGAPAVQGPFEYSLYRGGLNGSTPENWYLRSVLNCAVEPTHPMCVQPPGGDTPDYRSETSLYAALPSMVLLYGRTLLDTLHERQGDVSVTDADAARSGRWARVMGQRGDRDGHASGIYGSGPQYDYDFWALQGGTDLYRNYTNNGHRSRAGAFFALGTGAGNVSHVDGARAGKNNFMAYSGGVYFTHYAPGDAYVDVQALGTWYDADAKSDRLPALTTDGAGVSVSVEGGAPVKLGHGYRFEPQVQIVYQAIDLANSSDVAARVRFDDVSSLAGRVGFRVARDWQLRDGSNDDAGKLTAWIRPNLWYEFLGNPKTSFSSETGYIPFRADTSGATLELNAGLTVQVSGSAAVFANASYLVGVGGAAQGEAYDGKLGVKFNW